MKAVIVMQELIVYSPTTARHHKHYDHHLYHSAAVVSLPLMQRYDHGTVPGSVHLSFSEVWMVSYSWTHASSR